MLGPLVKGCDPKEKYEVISTIIQRWIQSNKKDMHECDVLLTSELEGKLKMSTKNIFLFFIIKTGLATHLQEQESFSVIQMPNLENPDNFGPWHYAREFLRETSACTIEIKKIIAHSRIHKNEAGIEPVHEDEGQALVHSAYLRGAAKHVVIALLDPPHEREKKQDYLISTWFGPPTIEIQCHAKENKV